MIHAATANALYNNRNLFNRFLLSEKGLNFLIIYAAYLGRDCVSIPIKALDEDLYTLFIDNNYNVIVDGENYVISFGNL